MFDKLETSNFSILLSFFSFRFYDIISYDFMSETLIDVTSFSWLEKSIECRMVMDPGISCLSIIVSDKLHAAREKQKLHSL